MKDADCVAFLQWALPQLHLRWPGFRRVREQVCQRVARRCAALGLDLAGYRAHLAAHPDEWRRLDEMCLVTISRFGRDRAMWDRLLEEHLPRFAREAATTVRAWSAGCGAGEEPYTLAIAWQLAIAPAHPGVAFDVLGTDAHEHQLRRAAAAIYPAGTLRELPDAWRKLAFEHHGDEERLRAPFRTVRFERRDLREPPPAGPFELVLCRNAAFTYFEEPVQRQVADALRGVLRAGGVLVVGMHEQLPAGVRGFAPQARSIYLAE